MFSMRTIHPTAIVDRGAELAEDVQIGPFAVVGAGVTIGSGSVVKAHCVVEGPTVIGDNCQIGPAAYVGLDPQHLVFLQKPIEERRQTWLVIGNHVIIRENASAHRSTHPGGDHATRIGDHCMLMGASHVAHDCVLEDHVVMANAALLAGHVTVGARTFLGGSCGIHQFCRIGRLAVLAGNEQVGRDVPPFAGVFHGGLKGYNAVGCKRAGMPRDAIKAIRAAYQCIHTHRTTSAIVAAIEQGPQTPEVREIIDFINTATRRGVHPSVRFLNYLRQGESEE
jgi:UDP-N-acetylglucosamine acyltransferase